jgi:hypothetical protein
VLLSFKEGALSDNVGLYINAYKVARRKYSFLKLMRGAEGRGVLLRFLSVAVLAFFYPDCGRREFMQKLGVIKD